VLIVTVDPSTDTAFDATSADVPFSVISTGLDVSAAASSFE
jgi:hypothetical protein